MGCSDSKEGEAAQQQQQQPRGVSGSRPTRGGSPPPPPANALLEAPLTPPSQRRRSRGTSRGGGGGGGGGGRPPRIVGVGHSSEPSSPAGASPSPNGSPKGAVRPTKSAGLSPRSPHSLHGGSRGSRGAGELPAKSPPAKQSGGLNLSRQSSYTKSQNPPPPPSGYPPPPHDVVAPSPSGSPTSPQSDEPGDVPGFDGTLPPQPSAAALREPQPSVASTTASARQQHSTRRGTATEENSWDPDGISGGFRHPPPASHSAAAPFESSAAVGGRGASQPTHADAAPAPQPMFDDAVYGHLSGPRTSRPPPAAAAADTDGDAVQCNTPLGLVFDAALARSDARNEVLMAPLPSPSLATSKAEAAGGGGRPVLMEKEHSFVKPRAPSSRGDTHSAVNSWERGTTLHHQQQPTPQLVASSTHSVNAKFNQFASYVDGVPGEPGVGSSRQQPSRTSASRQSQRSSRHDQRRQQQQQQQRPLPAVSDTASHSSSPPRSDGPSPTGVARAQHRGQRSEQARRQPRAPAAADDRPDAAGLALALPTSLPTSVERPTDLMPSYAALNIAPAASEPPSRPPSVVTSARDPRTYGGSRAGGVDRQVPREGSVFGHASDAFHGASSRSQQPQVAGAGASGAWSPQLQASEGRSSQKQMARPVDERALSPTGSEYSVRRQQREPYLSCVPCSVATTVRGCTETMYKGTRQVVACVPVEYSDVAQPSPVGERSHAPRSYTS